MNILILGASGKIGKCITEFLIKKKFYNITLVSNSNLKKYQSKKIKYLNIDVYENNNSLLNNCIKNDIIINCIGEYKNKSKMEYINYGFIKKLFKKNKKLINSKHIHWIQLSSIGVYKNTGKYEIVNENSLIKTYNYYEETKLKTDNLLINLSKEYSNIKYTIIRPSIVFGNNELDSTINKLMKILSYKFLLIINFKNVNLPFVHIQDLSKFIEKIISSKNEKNLNQIFNISGNYKILDLIEVYKKNKYKKFYFNLFNLKIISPLFIIVDYLFSSDFGLKLNFLTSKTFFSNKKINKYYNFQINTSIKEYYEKKH